MAILNFNYNRAINQAAEIENIADDMLTLANRQFQTTVDSIEVCWRGEASRQFLNTCILTQADIRAQAKKLKELASRIRQVARIIKEAEERARAAQRRRSSEGNS